MKRAWVFGLLVGVVLSGGALWVFAGGPFYIEPTFLSNTMTANQHLKDVTPTQQINQTPTLDQAIQNTPPFVAEDRTLQSLTKEELQTLITLSGQNAIKSAIDKVSPAVVRIDVTHLANRNNALDDFFRNDPFFDQFRDNQPEGREANALGAGFFFEYNGRIYVLSNNHVTEDATSIQILSQDHGSFSARVIGADVDMDVSVLQIDDFRGRNVPTVALGNTSATEVGDWVVAIGSPLGLTQTVTAGIVSALSRDNIPNPNSNRPFRSLVQTDAAINPGNSGGPLVNAFGEVVGINTLIAAEAEGLNFAINIDAVKRALPQLIEHGQITRAWLGVYIETVTEDTVLPFSVPDNEGVLVTDVVAGAPAYGSLRPNDVITHVDGVRVTRISELQDEIEFKSVGEPVEMTVMREGQLVNVMVNVGRRLPADQIPPPNVNNNNTPEANPEPELDVETEALEKFGLRVEALTEERANQLRLSSTDGVMVVEVESDSRSAWARMRQGDVIIELNEQTIQSIADWNQVVRQLDDRAPLMMRVLRNGGMVLVVMN